MTTRTHHPESLLPLNSTCAAKIICPTKIACASNQLAEREASKSTSSSAAAPREVTQKELLLKRPAILDERADTKLGIQDKAVFQYREERQLQY
jgi:hypothetical protein